MTGRDRPEPLWAGSLADPPRPEYDDVIVRVLEEPEEAAPPAADRPPGERRALLPALLAALAVVALAIALDRPGSLTTDELPSHWGDVPMTCDTVRMERDGGAVEWFWCRAVGGLSLPPGVYESPDAQWRSDVTRAESRASRVRISPDGDVAGWAIY